MQNAKIAIITQNIINSHSNITIYHNNITPYYLQNNKLMQKHQSRNFRQTFALQEIQPHCVISFFLYCQIIVHQ